MIAVFGAGAIGCWVGGRLAAAGAEVTLIGRARVLGELAGGLRTSELGGREAAAAVPDRDRRGGGARGRARAGDREVGADGGRRRRARDGAARGRGRRQPAERRAQRRRPARGAARAARARGDGAVQRDPARAGCVPPRVGGRAARRRRSGGRTAPRGVPAAALPIEPRPDMAAVQWAKLVLNLNNAINALSGLPLAVELAQRRVPALPRRIAARGARAARRGAGAGREADRDPAALDAAPARHCRTACSGCSRGASSRSIRRRGRRCGTTSRRRRPTEIDYLQGEVVALARRVGRTAPITRGLVQLVRAAEAGGRRTFTGDELAAALGVR